jgi:hypothetical protein
MGLDRSLDEEGLPDLEGPLDSKAATGDPQEGLSPPTDRPVSDDYGTTGEEQSRPEPLEVRVARELPDRVRGGDDDERIVLVEPDDEDVRLTDEEGDAVARRVDEGSAGLSTEEAAVHVEPDSGSRFP